MDELREAIMEERTRGVVLRNYKKDGTLFFNDLTVSPVFDDGRATRFVGVQDDVTEFVRAEEVLRVRAEAGEVLATSLSHGNG